MIVLKLFIAVVLSGMLIFSSYLARQALDETRPPLNKRQLRDIYAFTGLLIFGLFFCTLA